MKDWTGCLRILPTGHEYRLHSRHRRAIGGFISTPFPFVLVYTYVLSVVLAFPLFSTINPLLWRNFFDSNQNLCFVLLPFPFIDWAAVKSSEERKKIPHYTPVQKIGRVLPM